MLRILCLLSVLLLSACGDDAIKAAGVIVQSSKDGQTYFLLADHTGGSAHRGYGAFGGGLEKGETLQQGALREFHEETACHFLNHENSISDQYVRNGKYVSFVVNVNYIDEAILNQGPIHTNCDGGVFSERIDWVWVEKSDFLKQIHQGNEYKTNSMDISIWKKSSVIFLKAEQAGLL